MKRFTTEYTQGNYTVQKDNSNGYYAVFKKCNGFSQQVSKWHLRFGYAVRICNKNFSKTFQKVLKSSLLSEKYVI